MLARRSPVRVVAVLFLLVVTIPAAALIFAASMWGLLFSSIGTVIQGGFVIGAGILLDTFLVRTITVPAMATLVGEANWWPSRPKTQGSNA